MDAMMLKSVWEVIKNFFSDTLSQTSYIFIICALVICALLLLSSYLKVNVGKGTTMKWKPLVGALILLGIAVLVSVLRFV